MNKPMCQSRDIGLDGLYFGKWGKKSPLKKSRHDFDLDQTMFNVKFIQLFPYTTV